MRALYLVCYDISEPKMLTKVRHYLNGFRVAGQKSCFECWMTTSELHDAKQTLAKWLNAASDKAHFFLLDPRCINEYYGVAHSSEFPAFYVL